MSTAQVGFDLSTDRNDVVVLCVAQVQSWAYTSKTRVLRAAARSARDFGVRVRELAPEELTDELRAKHLHDVTGALHDMELCFWPADDMGNS